MRGADVFRFSVFVRVFLVTTLLLSALGLLVMAGGDPSEPGVAGALAAHRTSTVTATTTPTPSPTEMPPDAQPEPPSTAVPTTAPPPPDPTTTVTAAEVHRPVKVMVIGDSVAKTLADAVNAQRPSDLILQNEGILGCGVVQGGPFTYFGATHDALPQCEAWQQTWQAAVDRDRPDVALVLVGRWELMDRQFQGRWTHIGDAAFDAYLGTEVDTAIRIASSTGARVALATTPYYHRGPRPDGGTWPEDDPARVDRVNELFRAAAARHPGQVVLLDLGARMSPNGQLAMDVDGIKLRSDGVHVAHDAGPWIAPWLFPQLYAIADHQL